MRMNKIRALLLIVAAANFWMSPASAYTISVMCQVNSLAPPGRPWQNADCFYSWAAGGDALATQGSWISDLSRYGNGQLLHAVERPQFSFTSSTPPDSTYILCTNLTETLRLSMYGKLWRLTIGGTWGAGGWSQIDYKTDYALPFVSNPVACP